MRLKPVNDKIVVKEIKKQDDVKTPGGIILPDTVQDGGLEEGRVMAVSEGMYSAQGTVIPLSVSEGDTVLYSKHAQKSEHKIDGDTYFIMSQNEVMSIVEEK